MGDECRTSLGSLYSSVDETVPPVDETGQYTIEDGAPFGPDEPIWLYMSSPPEDFYSPNTSGAERRPEGTTLICEGASGHLFEVTDSGEIVWDYVNPIGGIGTSGTHVWNGVPPGSLYFLIVGTDDTGVYESTWGRDSSGNLRNGKTASFQCGATTKIVSSICP